MELLLFHLLLCTLPTVNTVTHLIENIFDLDASMGAMNHLVIDKNTGKLYVGAVNRIYMLDKNLQVSSEVETGKRLDNPMCSERIHQATCNIKETLTNSINKALLIDYDNERLIACTTLFHGICEKYHLDDIQKKDDTIYLAMVANNETATTFLFIAPGPEIGEQIKKGNVLYAGVSLTTTGRSNVRDRIPAFCSRNLDDFAFVHSGLSASTTVKIESSLRLSFPVFYIYGFGWEGFSYMVTIQKKNPGAETYISKMLRVCQDDHRFYSYAEVELECMSNGVHYNLAQAVYLGKPGKKLSVAIGIREDEEVMYATFSVGHPNSADAGTDSAVCVYPMRKIRSQFTKNIKLCFSGMGNTGPAQIITPDNCRDTPALKISDDYCGEHEVNQPIDGTMPIKGNAVVTFNQTGTAITMTTVSDYAVIFVGTKNGHIIKIALETQDSGKAYEDVPLMEGSEINSDMFVQNDKDGESEYLYAMTDRKLVKMKLHECSQYTTCGTCLGANDPYCGWCSLENKCSLRTECSEPEQELRWLSYSSQSCTTITSVIPDKIQKEHKKTTQLQLHVKNLPSFSGTYECVFSGLGYTLPTTITTVQLQHQITCETPKPNLLPAIPTGEDHIIMDLAIQIGGSDFVTTQFTFFDCSVHTDCSSCTLSEYPCTWCINNHMCTHNASQECMENILVHDKKSETSTELVGPKQCPRIEIDKSKQNSMFLVPSGTSKKIIVSAVNLQDIQMANIKCYFMMGISGKEVSAKVTQGDSPDLSTIECQSVDFSYGENSPKINVPFYINWRNNMALDNPEKIQVSMYKCEEMATTCGDCISMEVWYNCGWCQNDNTCSIYLHCKTDKTWLPREQTCPNVQITSINPDTGPKKGGTLLTIKGINLGTNFADIIGGINVAGVSCNPIKDYYEPPHTIVCKTGSFDSIQTGKVRVNIGNKYSASASQKFTYVVPEMKSMKPVKGPVSGGTKVTITGRYLDAGTDVDINFGTYKCEVLERENTQIVCRTSKAIEPSTELSVLAEFDHQKVESTVTFEYIEDPRIDTVTPLKGIQSGGISITVTGHHLDSIQTAYMITRHEKYEALGNARRRRRRRRRTTVEEYRSNCEVPKVGNTVMYCYSPKVSNTTVTPDRVNGVRFWYGFKLDNIEINRTGMTNEVFMVYPDPVFEGFTGNKEKSFQSKTDNYLTINGRNLNLGFNSSDVTVRIGKAYCNVTSIDKHGNQLNCKPPKVQPEPAQGHKYPEIIVQVGRNLTTLVGFLKYDEPETLPLDVIIGLGVGGGVLVLVVVIFFVLWCIKARENTSMKKKWQIQMDNLEVKVAKECKEAFAELQTDMTELTSDHFGQISIPFWDYRTYCMRVLFPQDEDSHAVIKELDVEFSRREQVDQGLKLFSQLVGNKTFLLTFVRTLEMNKKFSMRDRVNVASLISVALQTRMEYATEILKTLLAELIEKSVEGKNHPKLLLRRTESVAEKMLTNWFTFLLYKFLKECAGEPLFMLYQAIKQQTSKGPVDTVTSEARYSLSEDKLIRQQVDYKPMTIYVKDLDQHVSGQQSQAVKVLDCDTISQVKEKILDSIYKNAPFSSRPIKQNVDLVLFAQSPSPEWEQSHVERMILSDVDNTTKLESDCKRLNNLAHYQVPEGAYMALVSKQQTPSIYDLSNSSEKSNNSKNFDYKRFGKPDDYNTLIYNSRSPSLNRTASPQNVQIDIDNNSSNGVKYYHLVKQHDQDGTKEGDRSSKMVSEIYLTRLLATKGTLQQFVDDLFERIFSTVHRGTSLPLAIKYMFDFLDDQALLHNIQDPDVVHTWKSNSLPLRFWVNVIKNPNFVFDIYKSNIVDSCLSVVAQNFMDSCSMSEHKLGKDSPSSKLLYAKDIPTYKKWVDRYYQDIKMMPAISDQDMTAMMTEESRNHSDEFNVNAALFELYKYVNQYNEDLTTALDEDEFARKNRLNVKLEQVHAAMNGQSHC